MGGYVLEYYGYCFLFSAVIFCLVVYHKWSAERGSNPREGPFRSHFLFLHMVISRRDRRRWIFVILRTVKIRRIEFREEISVWVQIFFGKFGRSGPTFAVTSRFFRDHWKDPKLRLFPLRKFTKVFLMIFS